MHIQQLLYLVYKRRSEIRQAAFSTTTDPAYLTVEWNDGALERWQAEPESISNRLDLKPVTPQKLVV